jgi:hypothetical protein
VRKHRPLASVAQRGASSGCYAPCHNRCASSTMMSGRSSGQNSLAAATIDHADSRFRGRPSFAPLALAAAAFALDRRRPPLLPVDAANKRVPNARSTSPGTETSTSSEGHDNASPAGDSTTASSFEADARSKPATMARGMDIEPPPLNTSSIASAPETYRAFTTDEGSATRASPRARARPYRS